jgi:hypothetical protein
MTKSEYVRSVLKAITEVSRDMDYEDENTGTDSNLTGVDISDWNDELMLLIYESTRDKRRA